VLVGVELERLVLLFPEVMRTLLIALHLNLMFLGGLSLKKKWNRVERDGANDGDKYQKRMLTKTR
jgi:hypothetical protein